MSSTGKKVFVVSGVLLTLVGLWFVNGFVYPLRADSPNYSDVERAFAKLQFPSDWVEVKSSQNSGMFGRGCDRFNAAGCFHKSKTFKVPDTIKAEDVKKVLLNAGCPGVIERDITQTGESKTSYNMQCSLGGGISFGLDHLGPKTEVYVSAKTY